MMLLPKRTKKLLKTTALRTFPHLNLSFWRSYWQSACIIHIHPNMTTQPNNYRVGQQMCTGTSSDWQKYIFAEKPPILFTGQESLREAE